MLREEKLENQLEIIGIHRNVCPYCQCGRLLPEVTERETTVDDDHNGSAGVDDGDDKDADSERWGAMRIEDE